MSKKKAWERKQKPFSGECHFCKLKTSSINAFYCWSCRKWFCAIHRMPEDHNCIGQYKDRHKELHMTAGRIIYSKNGSEYHTE